MANLDIDQHMMDIFDFKRRIGKGAYGIVWKAVDKRSGEVVAVKKIFDAFKNKTDAQRTYREIKFLRSFGIHPNIITLKDVHRANNNLDIYLIFDYMDTDLHNVITTRGILADVHKRFIMYQLLHATKFIHEANVVHRDQKPSNILIDKYCRCMLADFGLARSLSSENDTEGAENPLTDYVATRWYRPPEVLVASRRYTYGIDMWSLGCILAEMLLGRAIFPGTSTVDQVERILSVLGPPSTEDVKAICSSGVGVGLLSRTPRYRNPLKDVLRGHPEDAIDLVTRLLVLNPDKRLSAEEALEHSYVRRFIETSPVSVVKVHPEIEDDSQWSVDEYRTKLYKLHGVPRVRSSLLLNSHSQMSQNGVQNSRGKVSSHQSKWQSPDAAIKKTSDFKSSERKNSAILPPMEATQQTIDQSQKQCLCKKNGCHRNSTRSAPQKATVPNAVPLGPKLHKSHKLPAARVSNMAPPGFLPQATSTPRRKSADEGFNKFTTDRVFDSRTFPGFICQTSSTPYRSINKNSQRYYSDCTGHELTYVLHRNIQRSDRTYKKLHQMM